MRPKSPWRPISRRAVTWSRERCMNLRIWVMGHAVSRATGKLAFSFGSVKSHRFRVQALTSFQYCSIHAKVHQNLARYLPRNKTCQSGGILRKGRCQGGGGGGHGACASERAIRLRGYLHHLEVAALLLEPSWSAGRALYSASFSWRMVGTAMKSGSSRSLALISSRVSALAAPGRAASPEEAKEEELAQGSAAQKPSFVVGTASRAARCQPRRVDRLRSSGACAFLAQKAPLEEDRGRPGLSSVHILGLLNLGLGVHVHAPTKNRVN